MYHSITVLDSDEGCTPDDFCQPVLRFVRLSLKSHRLQGSFRQNSLLNIGVPAFSTKQLLWQASFAWSIALPHHFWMRCLVEFGVKRRRTLANYQPLLGGMLYVYQISALPISRCTKHNVCTNAITSEYGYTKENQSANAESKKKKKDDKEGDSARGEQIKFIMQLPFCRNTSCTNHLKMPIVFVDDSFHHFRIHIQSTHRIFSVEQPIPYVYTLPRRCRLSDSFIRSFIATTKNGMLCFCCFFSF
mgnify:CR=1 FL=1